MGRAEQRLYTVGRFWLALRAQSPFYQIRWYDEATKTTRGKSTGCGSLLDAKRAIHAHAEADLSGHPQPADDAATVPILLRYYDEHGRSRSNAATIDSSLRIFTAFLDQDRAGIDVTVAALTPDVFKRFQAWRLALIRGTSNGAESASSTSLSECRERQSSGTSTTCRAALNHAAGMGRIPMAPKVRSVESGLRSPARSTKLSIDQLGAIVAYAAYDIEALRWVLGMLATGARPNAVLAWDVAAQLHGANFDTHPKGWPVTKKRNAVVPVIPEFRPWLDAWAACPHKRVGSRKTWWRTMRDALGLTRRLCPRRSATRSQPSSARGASRWTKSRGCWDTSAIGGSPRAMPSMIRTGFPMQSNSLASSGRRFVHLRRHGTRITFVSHQLTSGRFQLRESWKMPRVSADFGVVGGDGLEPPTLSV
jgi:hypothetical protein